MCHADRNDHPEAFRLFSDALKLAKNTKNAKETAKINLELGLVFIYFGEAQVALKLFEEAETLFKKLNDDQSFARARYLSAICHKRLGDFELSTSILEEVKGLYETLKDTSGLARAHNAIGVNYKNLRKTGLAIDNYEKSIELFRIINDDVNLAKAYNNLANIYQIEKKWDKSIEMFEKSLDIKQSLKDTLGIAITYMNISVIYKRNGSLPRALEYANKSIATWETVKANPNKSRVGIGIYNLMSDLNEQMGNFQTALKYSNKEKELIRKSRVNDEATLIDLFEKKQDVKFYTISDSLLKSQKELQSKFDEAQTKNEVLTKEKSYVFNSAMVIVIILLIGLVVVIYGRFLSAKRMKDELETINSELYETRISKAEKEVLLQEIHHRVKNNMQIISSLIRLQSNQTEVLNAKELFNETQNRINSMALVHEQLYRTKDFEKLELNGYLTELVNHLITSYQIDIPIEQKIDLSLNKASIDYIIPIGLIVNEVISNSLKHAFHGLESGLVCMKFHENENGGYTLELSDNGRGDVENADDSGTATATLGMELIESLVTQIDGVMTLDKTNGYHYTIKIPQIIKPLS